MDLAVVGALLVKERLTEKSGLQSPNLMNEQPLDEYPAPRSVPSQASFVMAGRRPIVSVSGGVQIFPWQVADRTEVSKDLASARDQHPAARRGTGSGDCEPVEIGRHIPARGILQSGKSRTESSPLVRLQWGSSPSVNWASVSFSASLKPASPRSASANLQSASCMALANLSSVKWQSANSLTTPRPAQQGSGSTDLSAGLVECRCFATITGSSKIKAARP